MFDHCVTQFIVILLQNFDSCIKLQAAYLLFVLSPTRSSNLFPIELYLLVGLVIRCCWLTLKYMFNEINIVIFQQFNDKCA